jgi:hypothetical protein
MCSRRWRARRSTKALITISALLKEGNEEELTFGAYDFILLVVLLSSQDAATVLRRFPHPTNKHEVRRKR